MLDQGSKTSQSCTLPGKPTASNNSAWQEKLGSFFQCPEKESSKMLPMCKGWLLLFRFHFHREALLDINRLELGVQEHSFLGSDANQNICQFLFCF